MLSAAHVQRRTLALGQRLPFAAPRRSRHWVSKRSSTVVAVADITSESQFEQEVLKVSLSAGSSS